MDGVVYFGPHSVDVSKWVSKSIIDDALDEISGLIQEIHESGYAKTNAPNDWSHNDLLSVTFWNKVEAATENNNQLIGYVGHKLFDEVLKNCIDTKRSYEEAEKHLMNGNPNSDKSEYYGAFKKAGTWPDVPENVHISNKQELNNWSKKFLVEYPVSEDSYAVRCKKIFPNLIFHPDFSETLKGHGATSKEAKYGKAPETGVNGFSSSITNVLSVLNDVDIHNKPTKEILSEIQAKSDFECTEQGGNKSHLKFRCEIEDSPVQEIPCEYHIKINLNNRNDGVHYQDRVYFGFLDIGEAKKIFVAHSGKHLNP